MNRASLSALIAAALLMAGATGGGQPTASPSSHLCERPVEQAIARPDGSVVGRKGPDGRTIAGTVWLEPLIDKTPVEGNAGEVDALLAVPQPPVELLACHGGRLGIRYPVCDDWAEGKIDALDPTTGNPTVRIVPTLVSAGDC